MTWIPDLPSFYSSLKRIENGEDLQKESVDLFWLFCNHIMSPKEFSDRMMWFRDHHTSKVTPGVGFRPAELEEIMIGGFEDSEGAANRVLEKFDAIINSKSVEYIPDSVDPILPLYVYSHLESARLFRLLKVQEYSDATRESLGKALNSLTRCYRSLEGYTEEPWPLEYSISLEAVGSFLKATNFYILKSDGRYEDALIALIEGLEHIQESYTIFENNRSAIFESTYFYYVNFTSDLRKTTPWIKDLTHQLFVDCFEAIRRGNRIDDTKRLAEICESLIDFSDEPWLSNNRSDSTYMSWSTSSEIINDVKTEEYYWDHASDYWQYALGWVEAQLNQSQFKEVLDEREEQVAEKRLSTYFFSNVVWDLLPNRTRSALISADQDMFGGKLVRIESILNELKISIEEMFMVGLWNPMKHLISDESEVDNDLQAFVALRDKLKEKGLNPDLSHFEQLCRLPITDTYLTKRGIDKESRKWFAKKLPKCLALLRKARRKAEHGSDIEWTKEELFEYYAEFIGIGQQGIIPKIAKVLLYEN